VLGIIKSLFWAHAPKAISALAYCLIGLSAAPFLPQIAPQLGILSTVLICIGGALYLVGAVIYALRKPDPWPEFFGYHEIFHLLVIAGATCHYIVILRTLS
jgi:hemolysin III